MKIEKESKTEQKRLSELELLGAYLIKANQDRVLIVGSNHSGVVIASVDKELTAYWLGSDDIVEVIGKIKNMDIAKVKLE